MKSSNEKWIQDAVKRPGALHKALGIPEDETIPLNRIRSELGKLEQKRDSGKTLTKAEQRFEKQLNFALTMKTKMASKEEFLRSRLIRLAYENPSFRKDLLPLIKKK